VDRPGSGTPQGGSRRRQAGAGGDDVVDQQDAALHRPTGGDGETLEPLGPRAAPLGAGPVVTPQARPGRDAEGPAEAPGQQRRLVVAPALSAGGRGRHPHHPVDGWGEGRQFGRQPAGEVAPAVLFDGQDDGPPGTVVAAPGAERVEAADGTGDGAGPNQSRHRRHRRQYR
jgi:hypothetical protein